MSEIKDAQGRLTTQVGTHSPHKTQTDGQLERCATADGALSSLKMKIKRREQTKQKMEERKAKALKKLEEDEESLSADIIREQQTKVSPSHMRDADFVERAIDSTTSNPSASD
jgi:hypothetical protein